MNIRAFLFTFLCFAVSQLAIAASPGACTTGGCICSGAVNSLLIYNDGTVNLRGSWRDDYTHICNLKTDRQGIDVMTCAMWVNTIEAARKLNATIFTYYSRSADAGLTCDTLPTYSNAPAPVYFGH